MGRPKINEIIVFVLIIFLSFLFFDNILPKQKIVLPENIEFKIKKEYFDLNFKPVSFETLLSKRPEYTIKVEFVFVEKPTKEIIIEFLKYIGEENNLDKWIKIINRESKFNVDSVAPTYWSLCDQNVYYYLWGYKQGPTRFVELKDYPDGRIWQATCEEFGAKTIKTGRTRGLTHILDTTWEMTQCSGNKNNWQDELICAKKIKDLFGWKHWSYI
ncbi:MAG: hypothetical protein NZZ41_04280 [Candidatus Dojkabacteria bacterium]|nr:hypothetical protein [Candidatus Dojkabacteria bacterium]